MHNHLLIGLGGTGGNVLKAFRKTVYEDFRSVAPEDIGFNLNYLYVDSSSADLRGSEAWRTQGDVGADISLDEENRFSITTNNLAERLGNPEYHSITHSYIGNPIYWNEILSSMNINETAGGQIRRLGVALFEPRCPDFVEHVKRMVRGLGEKSGKAETSFHVFAGLAGGTGSGAFLHVIAQLRSLYSESRHYPIYLYLLLPEPNSPWAKNNTSTNYYANGFAALKELNAYLISNSKGGPLFAPIDLSDNQKITHFENEARGGDSKLKDRLQGCFLVSTINEKNNTLSVSDVPDMIAQLLYQRIFLLENADPGRYRGVQDAVSLENLNAKDESRKTDENIKLRSLRFQAFGVKRIVIPEEEIREHFSANFAHQAALQMRYNNWPEHVGVEYLAEPRRVSFKTFVQEEKNRQIWDITMSQVKLESGILPDEKNARPAWKSIQQDWEDVTPHLKKEAWGYPHENGRDVRLDVLQKEFQHRYLEVFRGMGVEAFYDAKQRDITKPDRHIAYIRDTLEQWMLREWAEGGQSATDLIVLLDDLIEDVEQRLRAIPGVLEKLEEREKSIQSKIAANRDLWGQTSIVGRVFGKREKLFEHQAELLRESFELRSLQVAWRFAAGLQTRLLAELRDKLRSDLINFRNGLDDAIHFFEIRALQTCQIGEKGDVQDNVIKFYEPDKVHKFVRTLLEHEKEQKSWAGSVRRGFLATVNTNQRQNKGKERFFASLVANGIKNGDLKRVLEEVSRRNSEAAHADQTGEQGRFIGVNIVTKMAEQFSDEKRLQQYVLELVRSSQTFMKYNNNEFGGSRPESVMAILLPECPDKAQFRARLAELFVKSQGDGAIPFVIDTTRKINEITLISLKYAFPLRFLQPVHDLEEKYIYRLEQGSRERAVLEVHIEDRNFDLPSLLRPLPGHLGKKIIPLIQLALVLGLLHRDQDPDTGHWDRVLEVKNEFGIPVAEFYSDELAGLFEVSKNSSLSSSNKLDASNIEAILLRVTEGQFEKLQSAVDDEMAKEKYRKVSERQQIKEALQQQILAVRENRAGNVRDQVYLKLVDSTQVAINYVNSLRYV
jgi:hypothetical protein